MGLLPEFFIVLGIVIFLAMSLLIAVLDEDMPSSLQYLFQGAALIGLVQLFMSQSLTNTGILGRAATDVTRFLLSIVYLTSAVSTVVGLNVYLAAVRRKMDLASAFSGTLTVPIFMVSALFVSSFLGSGGEVSFSPATMVIAAVSMLVISLSMFWLQREASKRISNAPGGRGSSPTGPVSTPPEAPAIGLPLHLHSMRREDEWEEPPTKGKDEQ